MTDTPPQPNLRILGIMIALPWLGLTPELHAAPSGWLNDTGQTRCLNTAGTALENCSAANTGDSSPNPSQDGRYGRDPAAANGFSKPAGSGGSGGFAFIPLDASGTPITLTGTPPVPSATPRCIQDTVTNLIWEVKTTSGLQDQANTYGWGSNNTGTCTGGSGCSSNAYIADVNALNLCGETANDWRLPTLPELLSIVDHDRASGAMIDTDYFPNTQTASYWSANALASSPNSDAWYVRFSNGLALAFGQSSGYYVRLVRSGQ